MARYRSTFSGRGLFDRARTASTNRSSTAGSAAGNSADLQLEPHLRTFACTEPDVCPVAANRSTGEQESHDCGELQRPTAASRDDAPSRYGNADCSRCPATDDRHERSTDVPMIDLTVCSICLRVRHGSGWYDAESVSEEITSGDGEPFRLPAQSATNAARELVGNRRPMR